MAPNTGRHAMADINSPIEMPVTTGPLPGSRKIATGVDKIAHDHRRKTFERFIE